MFWIDYVQCNQRKQKEAKPSNVMLLFQSFHIVFIAIENYWTKVTQSLRLVITNKFVLHCKWPCPIKSYFKLKIKGQHQILKFYSINAAEYFENETIKFGKRPQILHGSHESQIISKRSLTGPSRCDIVYLLLSFVFIYWWLGSWHCD